MRINHRIGAAWLCACAIAFAAAQEGMESMGASGSEAGERATENVLKISGFGNWALVVVISLACAYAIGTLIFVAKAKNDAPGKAAGCGCFGGGIAFLALLALFALVVGTAWAKVIGLG